jgi:hypothetical protein
LGSIPKTPKTAARTIKYAVAIEGGQGGVTLTRFFVSGNVVGGGDDMVVMIHLTGYQEYYLLLLKTLKRAERFQLLILCGPQETVLKVIQGIDSLLQYTGRKG